MVQHRACLPVQHNSATPGFACQCSTTVQHRSATPALPAPNGGPGMPGQKVARVCRGPEPVRAKGGGGGHRPGGPAGQSESVNGRSMGCQCRVFLLVECGPPASETTAHQP